MSKPHKSLSGSDPQKKGKAEDPPPKQALSSFVLDLHTSLRKKSVLVKDCKKAKKDADFASDVVETDEVQQEVQDSPEKKTTSTTSTQREGNRPDIVTASSAVDEKKRGKGSKENMKKERRGRDETVEEKEKEEKAGSGKQLLRSTSGPKYACCYND
jgi:hypothetical protein